MNAALFAISSPSQYMNAIEAARAFGLRSEQCYLAVGSTRGSAFLSRLEKDEKDWRTIQPLPSLSSSGGSFDIRAELRSLRKSRQYASLANKLIARARADWGSIGFVFVGDFQSRNLRHFFAAIPSAEHWVLDEGSTCLQTSRFRKDPSSPNVFSRPFLRGSRFRRLRAVVSGLRDMEPSHLGFFSSYDLDVASQDHLRRHTYSYHREHLPALTVLDEIWFLGANHVEKGIASESRYLAVLERVRNYYRGEQLVYLAHPTANAGRLNEIRALGMFVREPGLPAELVTCQTGAHPRVIAAIESPSLDTLPLILGHRVNVHLFRVGPAYAKRGRWNQLRDSIAYHQRNSLGTTVQIPEDHTGHFSGRARDYRVVLPVELTGPSQAHSRGYYPQSSGLLGGSWHGELRVDADTGALFFRLSSHITERPWHVGRRLRIRIDGCSQERLAEIKEVLLSGELVLAQAESFDLGGPSPATAEMHGARLWSSGAGSVSGVFIEPASENLLRATRNLAALDWQLDGLAPWSRGSTGRSRMIPGPDGTNEVAFIRLSRAAGEHRLWQHVRRSSDAGPLTFSVYASPGGIAQLELAIIQEASGFVATGTFDLFTARGGGSERSSGSPSGTHLSQTSFSERWQRCAISTIGPAGDVIVSLRLICDDQRSYPGDGCSGLYVWGPQLEPLPKATSYLRSENERSFREADEVAIASDLEFESVLLELSLPQVDQSVRLLSLSNRVVELEPAPGRLRVLQGHDVFEGPCAKIESDTPFVIGLERRPDSVWLSLEGSPPLRLPPLRESELGLRVRGGPLLLRRSISLPSSADESAFAKRCTTMEMARIDEPEGIGGANPAIGPYSPRPVGDDSSARGRAL